MFVNLSRVLLVVFMLVHQVGLSYASTQTPCHDASMQMMMEMTDTDNMSTTNGDMSCDCCQQDCACSMAIFSVAVLSELDIANALRNNSFVLPSRTSNLLNGFINHPKRPPKHSLI